jgi:hypothetical protein
LSILKPGNVATPLAAARTVVPERVPLAGFAPIATVMFPVKLVSVFPWPSRAVTCTLGVIVAPAAALEGCVVKTSSVAAPGVMAKVAVVSGVGPVLAARNR